MGQCEAGDLLSAESEFPHCDDHENDDADGIADDPRFVDFILFDHKKNLTNDNLTPA
jgi:hypothetical protein